MKKICFITSLIVVLSGCSNYVLPNGEQLGSKRWEEISDRMNKKVGLSEQELISQWGVPNGNYTLSNGSKIISYDVYNSRKDSYCEAKFLIERGKVTKWGHSGNKACGLGAASPSKLIPKTPLPKPTL